MVCKQKIIKFTTCFIILLLAGCNSIGPMTLSRDRFNYNKAMNYSSNQELLLNIVRLRYDESPLILRVSSISGSTSVQKRLDVSGLINFPMSDRTNYNLNPSGGIAFSDNPIITYTPLDDQKFTEAFLKPLELEDVALLLESAWSIPRVMRVGFQRIGNAVNAPSAARATSSNVPKYQLFIDVVYLLRRVQLADALTGYYSKKDGVEDLTLIIDKKYRFTATELAKLRAAGIEIYRNQIILSNQPGPHKVYVVTRAVLGVFNYLSKGVLEPKEDLKAKVLTETVYKNGAHFDWQNVLRGMMKIYHSNKMPADAYVAIPYRGRWYYIKDSDSDSKQTLTMLLSINGLVQIGAQNTSAPALARVV